MKGIAVTFKPTIELTLTADDWALYHIDGRDFAAYSLNRAIERAINLGASVDEARGRVAKALDDHRNYGADDTEGWVVATRILATAYPHHYERLTA